MTSVWFDSHCHLDAEVFDDDRTQVLDDSEELGIARWFVPGVSPIRWPRLLELRAERSGVSIGIGVHPFALRELRGEALASALESLAPWCERSQAVAVGECGLDALEPERGGADLATQRAVFERQVELAVELRLPLVVHVVRAHGAALEILRRHRLPRGGALHAYSGSTELVDEYAKLGFRFGFGAAACRERAVRARRALLHVPLDRLLLETDAPDQPPEGFPSRNEPRALTQIARDVARLRGIRLDELARVTTENATALFA